MYFCRYVQYSLGRFGRFGRFVIISLIISLTTCSLVKPHNATTLLAKKIITFNLNTLQYPLNQYYTAILFTKLCLNIR